MELVKPSIGLIFWMVVSFSIILILLKKFAWKPILTMIKEREESIEQALASGKPAEFVDKMVDGRLRKFYEEVVLEEQVFVIDGTTNTVSASVVVGANPDGVSVDPKSDKIYIANSGDGTVSVIDGKTNTISETIPAGTHVYGIAVDPSTSTIYAGNDSPGIVYVISESEKSQAANNDIWNNIVQLFSHLFNLK